MALDSESLSAIYCSYLLSIIRAPAIGATLFFLLQPSYNTLYAQCSQWMDDRYFVGGGLWVLHVLCYWSMNTFWWICDHFGYWQQFKIPRSRYQLPSRDLLIQTIRKALLGQLLIEPLAFCYILYPLWRRFSPSMTYDESEIAEQKLWYLLMIWFKFAVCDMMNRWLFYFAHRVLHHKALYGWIHKQHHEYKGSISFAAEYAHPIEQLFANQIPTLIGGVVTGAHPLQYFIWLIWRVQETYESHSGYAFYGTWLYSIGLTNTDRTLFHDFHHTANIGNYAGIAQDALFGTDHGFKEWFAKWKHKKELEMTGKRVGG